jgi:hypothetical protein
MKTILFFFALVLTGNCFAQNRINVSLKAQLDSILQTDQGIREINDTETSEQKKDSLALLFHQPKEFLIRQSWLFMQKIDSANLAKVEPIIAQYGYPGKTLVGEPTNLAVFYVVQHSGKIAKYYALVEEAGKKGELPFIHVAMMLDRKLLNEHKEQIYGTQMYSVRITDPKTGEKRMFSYVVPIKDAANVNKRRKEAGFDTTVEENTRLHGMVYKPYTYEQVEAIKSGKMAESDVP